jgi:hypothetical protein
MIRIKLRYPSALLAVALSSLACQGSAGDQGPAGPRGAPYSRAATYCNGVFTSATAANAWTLTASCNAIADIPVEGWCFEPAGLPTTAFRSEDAPVNWNDPAQLAGWTCSWGWQGGATTSPIPAKVEICCATP